MTDDLSYWKYFWDNQSNPLHRYNTDKWYRLYAKEINLIFNFFQCFGGRNPYSFSWTLPILRHELYPNGKSQNPDFTVSDNILSTKT
jgi:hypothetical protein